MSNKYENLIKLYYKKQNIEDEYIKRIENPSTFITDLKINPKISMIWLKKWLEIMKNLE